jgi:hypothetical protein
MFRGILVATIVGITVLAGSCPANADEHLVPLAQSGEWVAMAHKVSMTAAPDVCVAYNARSGVALRGDGDTVQLRVIDKKWSLPNSVQGVVLVAIGNWNVTLPIADNTDDSVSAEVSAEDIVTLLTNMDKASTMAVTVGKAKPISVSLAGSSKAANAFRTCAGIEGGGEKGGDNPFK